MLDPKHDASWTETHRQSFSINYNYPVYFTRDLFDPANPCLQARCRRSSRTNATASRCSSTRA